MLIYEVDLTVDDKIAADVAAWLPEHVREMVALPGFIRAVIYRPDGDEGRASRWTVHYHLADRSALDAYLSGHADRMRADGKKRFGRRMRAERRVLVEEGVFGH